MVKPETGRDGGPKDVIENETSNKNVEEEGGMLSLKREKG